jgi:hypothetical protein
MLFPVLKKPVGTIHSCRPFALFRSVHHHSAACSTAEIVVVVPQGFLGPVRFTPRTAVCTFQFKEGPDLDLLDRPFASLFWICSYLF